MIFVTGPLFSGKKSYVKQRMGWDDDTLAACRTAGLELL